MISSRLAISSFLFISFFLSSFLRILPFRFRNGAEKIPLSRISNVEAKISFYPIAISDLNFATRIVKNSTAISLFAGTKYITLRETRKQEWVTSLTMLRFDSENASKTVQKRKKHINTVMDSVVSSTNLDDVICVAWSWSKLSREIRSFFSWKLFQRSTLSRN